LPEQNPRQRNPQKLACIVTDSASAPRLYALRARPASCTFAKRAYDDDGQQFKKKLMKKTHIKKASANSVRPSSVQKSVEYENANQMVRFLNRQLKSIPAVESKRLDKKIIELQCKLIEWKAIRQRYETKK
jgi:hypothetical protein